MLRRGLASAPIHVETLPNGLRLLVRASPAAPVAEVQIWALAGSADERADEAGLAHFHEHMLFKGTRRRGVGEIAGEVEAAGGRINAYTSHDATVYHATVPSDRAGVALDVLADAVRFSRFDPEEIAREVEVVLEEIRRSEDDPRHVLSEALFAEAWRVHPYRAPVLGTAASVASFDRARVTAFFERWYAPNHLAVVVAGDVDPREISAAVRDAFADAAPGGAQRARPAEPEQRELRSRVLRRPFERASLDLGIRSVALAHPDAPQLDLLAFVLGQGDSSRLVRRLQDEEELVERIDGFSYTPLDPGLFGVDADCDPARALAAIAACARELERLRAEPVRADELEKARTNFLASLHFERESVSGQARKLGSFLALAGDHRREESYLHAIRSATPETLLRAAREHLSLDALTVGVLLPERDAAAAAPEDVARAVARGAEATRRAFAVPRALAPAAEIHAFELPGGARLHVLPRPDIPVVAVRAVVRGGLLAEDAKSAGLSSFLTSVWLRGTRTHSAADFASRVESLAADVDGFSGRSSLGLGLDCLAERLDPALDLFAEVLLEPAFAPDEIEKERRETLASLERREDHHGVRAFDLFGEALFGPHPYRFPVSGTLESVRGFDAAGVEAFHERHVRAPNLVFAVAGDVDPPRVAAALASRFAGLPAGATPPAEPAPPPPRARREVELRKDRAQAHLVIGYPGLTVADPDREALEVVTQLLSGQGGRLFLELRDRRSLAYSVSATNAEGVHPGFFAVYIATAPEKLDEARAGLLAELARLVDAPPGEPELENAKRCLIGNFAIDQQRAAARAMHVGLDALYGLGADAHLRYAARIAALGKDDVLRVARRIVDLDAYTLAVIRP
jgi:zinc protease